MNELIYADLGETISNLQRLEALESRCQHAEAALEILKKKVRRYLELENIIQEGLGQANIDLAEDEANLLGDQLWEICEQ